MLVQGPKSGKWGKSHKPGTIKELVEARFMPTATRGSQAEDLVRMKQSPWRGTGGARAQPQLGPQFARSFSKGISCGFQGASG